MRISFAILASIMTIGLTMPVMAQGCPPGLSKKGNGCLPPGQAKKTMPVYVSPPIMVYQPPVAYGPLYSDYRPSGGSLNLGVTVPLP